MFFIIRKHTAHLLKFEYDVTIMITENVDALSAEKANTIYKLAEWCPEMMFLIIYSN